MWRWIGLNMLHPPKVKGLGEEKKNNQWREKMQVEALTGNMPALLAVTKHSIEGV
jgi:hypothetical protein